MTLKIKSTALFCNVFSDLTVYNDVHLQNVLKNTYNVTNIEISVMHILQVFFNFDRDLIIQVTF